MKAIILAAGRGSRMKGLTEAKPKCLVEFRGKPLLDWQLSALREAGIEDIAIVTGYRRELLSNRGLTEFHNSRWAETQMVSSLACAERWLAESPCIVSYSDIFYTPQAIRALVGTDAPIAVTYDPDWLKLWSRRFENPLEDAETFALNTDGTLAEIGGKPSTVDEVKGQYMGLLRFSPEGWAEVVRIRGGLSSHVRDRLHMTGTLQRVIEAQNIVIAAYPYCGAWGEIDSEDDLVACHHAFLDFENNVK